MKAVDQAFDQLISDIQGTIGGSVTGSGFHAVNCPMCKNREQTQKKGGFKFESEQIGYSCFRGSCDANTVYTLGEPVPRKFRALMDAIGVQIPISLIASGRKKLPKQEDLDDRFEKNTYKTLSFPKEFSAEGITDYWADYLVSRNFIAFDLDLRYVTDGPYKGCLAVPHYFHDKLIGWVYLTKGGAYITETTSSESMLFFPEKVPPKRPLIVEGLPDAWCFPDAVATQRAKITPKQAYHLRHTDPIVLPDRHGSKLYESAKEYGWDICIPMWREKDLNEVVGKRGILVAAKMIYEGTMKICPKSEVLYKRWVGTK